MKIKWKNPEMYQLGLEETKKLEPIIINSNGEVVTFSMNPTYFWKCPCCQKISEKDFETKELAEAGFYENHEQVCPKYDRVNDRCIS